MDHLWKRSPALGDFNPFLPLCWRNIILETWLMHGTMTADGSECMYTEREKTIPFYLKTRHLRINMFHIQKQKFVFIKSGRNWRQEESGSMSRDRVEGIRDRRKFVSWFVCCIDVIGEQLSGEENWDENKIGKEREENRGRKRRE
ncbi:hypothetical protein LXL04_019967 [Taraxacum kok-saghyz]